MEHRLHEDWNGERWKYIENESSDLWQNDRRRRIYICMYPSPCGMGIFFGVSHRLKSIGTPEFCLYDLNVRSEYLVFPKSSSLTRSQIT
jgi:hypothetical protein